ncbi:hypothetical protein BE08_23180 [Sorangium cellulosum]|uniref:Uncharacterized protein n=1 Tax=Sorangium cellulosum TaxID=56 RepID=A0A150NYV0_SORCE|nr:hypothetical protein BE08_23180 [Sorangium cellulosum]
MEGPLLVLARRTSYPLLVPLYAGGITTPGRMANRSDGSDLDLTRAAAGAGGHEGTHTNDDAALTSPDPLYCG